jgi:TRAP-type mannitol/chloroaromatic compound transport system permease small subunit
MIKTIINAIDSLNEHIGRAASWLVLAMVLLICYDVAMRYFFQQGSVALQELEWHLFALIFLLGAAYTLKHNNHVRVDILYQSHYLSDRHRALINILGTLFFLLPFCILILITAWPFVNNAYFYQEGSPDPGGLPYRYLLKGSLLIAFSLLILQGIAELLRSYLIFSQQESN